MSAWVLDAHAVLAWLQGEQGAPRVREVLEAGEADRAQVTICVVNLGEVFYVTWRRRGRETANEVLRGLRALPWRVISADDALVWHAARLKAEHPLSYADAFAVATAKQEQSPLLTGDREITALPRGVVQLERLR